MSDFNFYLNRVGVRGPKGEQGEQGFSPIITVATNTLSEYILQIQTQNNTFLTANLREHKDDLGGTYIRYNRETGVMYAGEADTATTQNLGEVRFATATELERNDGSTVVTPADVNTLINARDYDGAIEAVDDKTDTNADNIATNAGNISTLQGQMAGVLSNYVTTDTEQFISGRKKFTNIIAINSGVINSARSDDKTWLYNNNARTVIGHNVNTTSLVGSEVDIRTSGQDINITRQGSQYTNIDTGNISNYVGNGTITFTQGGVTKGTITTNQSGAATIALDAGSVPGNMVTTDTTQTITGSKAFNGGLSTLFVNAIDSGIMIQALNGRMQVGDGSYTYLGLFVNGDVTINRSGTNYTNIDTGNIGSHALTSSNISTNAYIQALEARIAALEANINGGSAASA